jgi:Domain of unknown function (DUF4307)
MSTATRLPQGRYGRSKDERPDRGLRVVAAVLGVAFLALVGWLGIHYLNGTKISGQVVAFKTAPRSVQIHLEVHKDADTTGYCTVRSQSAEGAEVGRADFRFTGKATSIDKVVTLRTTAKGSTAELIGCHSN